MPRESLVRWVIGTRLMGTRLMSRCDFRWMLAFGDFDHGGLEQAASVIILVGPVSGLQIFGIDRQGFHDFGVAFDGDDDGAFVDPIAAAGCSGQDLSAIGEG